MASLLLAIIYLAFISLGLPDSLLGAGWPVMHGFFGVPLSWGGVVSMVISVGTVTSSLLSERLTKRFGARHVTLFSVLLTAMPAGSMVSLFATRYDRDPEFAANVVTVSTLLSLITIPLWALVLL